MNNFDFYNTINKPLYAPDRKIFGPVWSGLYLLMLVSFVVFYFAPISISKIVAIPLFAFQFILNLFWTPVFFRLKKIWLAFVICIALLITVVLMTFLFFRISMLLGILQIPYILWLIFAVKLNWDIVRLN